MVENDSSYQGYYEQLHRFTANRPWQFISDLDFQFYLNWALIFIQLNQNTLNTVRLNQLISEKHGK